jgi:hypothetical protein
LTLTEEGTSAVKQTLDGMSSLKSKVEATAEQILRLSASNASGRWSTTCAMSLTRTAPGSMLSPPP